jgi:3-oxoacyl-[acyl-carrier-protein] synthase II
MTDNRMGVAITGLGLVCSLGNRLAIAYENATRGASGIRRYRPEPAAARPSPVERIGGTVVDFDAAAHTDARYAAGYEPATNYGVAAAAEALADAGLDPRAGADSPVPGDRFGVALGAGLPGAELWQRILGQGDVAVPRMAAINITGNHAAGLLAAKYGLRGPSLGVANACASGASAIAIGADQIRLGRADAMLVGGCESSMRGLVAYESFTAAGMNVTDDPERACRPFDRARKGFVLAEGAAVLVLESLASARARGARIYAILRGVGLGNEAYHVISPEPTGTAWARTMVHALADAGVTPGEVDAVSAHAPGTPQGDLAEARAIHLALGARGAAVQVSSTKSMHGHAFGAAGAIETALAVAALADGVVLPTINMDHPDPECRLEHVRDRACRSEPRILVKNSFGAGGVSTCLVFERGDRRLEIR